MCRKHLLFPFFIIVFVFITGGSFALNGYFGGGSSDVASDTLTRGLVGYWNCEEGTGQTVNDSSDQNNDGTLGANSTASTDDPSWTASKAGLGGALSFDGGDFITIADNSSLNLTTNFTVSIWIKRSDAVSAKVLYDSGIQANHWYVAVASTNHICFTERLIA